ncbi:MAG: vWA domain-containing protein [Polyangiales bacterium]
MRVVPLCLALLALTHCRTGLYVTGEDEQLADATAETSDAAEVATDSFEDVDAEVPMCVPGVITLLKATPAVMLVLDRSGSMGGRLGTTSMGTRWHILTEALASALPSVDDTMAIGALFFPNATSPRGSETCNVSTSADLVPKTGNVSALITKMRANTPMGGTPTAVAIDTAAGILQGVRAAKSARALVLATDGAPGCNSMLDARTCRCASTTVNCRRDANMCLDDARTIERTKHFADLGLPTYVIGIDVGGVDDFSDVLDAVAIAGGRPLSTGSHKYYAAGSATELDAAIVTIRDQVAACTYLTTSVPDPGGSITVSVGGVEVPYDETGKSGWRWADETNGEIELTGDACSKAASTHDVSARVECRGG